MKVSDLFVRCLEAEGVRYVFGVPGEENEDLLFSLEASEIDFVPCRHEQGAAFIANMWGRLTGKAGVCLSTLGPGATNLLTGVADANLDKAPLVAITAQGSTARLHHESHQRLDIIGMFRPITKWNSAVHSPESVSEVIRKAFKTAEFEKPGATHVELSEDVAKSRVDKKTSPIEPRAVRRPAADYKAIKATLSLLRDSKRPLVIAGNGAIRKLASKHLREFSKKHGVPVVSTFMGKGAVSDFDSNSLVSLGLGFKDFSLEAVERADLILTVGYDVAEYSPEKWNPGGDKKIVSIDFVPSEVYAHYVPEVEVVGDISASLWELNRSSEHRFETAWYSDIRKRILDDIESYTLTDEQPLDIPGAINVIREVMPKDGLLISDVGTHKMWIARNYLTCCPNGCIVSNGLASMGISLPGAIAASLIAPERKIIAAMGDGGFMMNSQELETARRVGANFVVLVFNDDDYGLIHWKQEMSQGRSVSTKISNPDFLAYAKSFGIAAHRPSNARELKEALDTALERRELSLVEVRISTKVNMALVEKLHAYWRTDDAS